MQIIKAENYRERSYREVTLREADDLFQQLKSNLNVMWHIEAAITRLKTRRKPGRRVGPSHRQKSPSSRSRPPS